MSFVNNFVGFTKKSDVLRLGKSETYNMYVQTTDSNEHSFKSILLPFPGYESVSNASGSPRGIYQVSRGINGKPAIYGVWGSTLYLLNNGTLIPIINYLIGSTRCTFAETGGYGENHPHLAICDGNRVYVIDTTLQPSDQSQRAKVILMPKVYGSSAESEDRITPAWVAQCWNHLIVGEKNSDIFYHSIQYPFETRTNSGDIDYDVFEASTDNADTVGYGHWNMSEWQPDNTLIGCANASYLYTFGVKSYQVFQYNQSSTLPFVCPNGSAGNIGIRGAESLATNNNVVYWLGSAENGVGCVYAMVGNNPNKISTKEIEAIIRKCNMDLAKGFIYKWDNHDFYVLTFATDGVTIAYDITEGGWITLGSRTTRSKEGCFRYLNSIIAPNGTTYLQGNDVLVKATTDTWYEHDNTPILRKRVGGVISSDNMNMKIGRIRIYMNNGQYPYISKNANLVMRYSPDTLTWSPKGIYPIGVNGSYEDDVDFRGFEKCKRLSIEVGSSDNFGLTFYGIDIKGVTCN